MRCSGPAVVVAAPCSQRDGVLAGAESSLCMPFSETVRPQTKMAAVILQVKVRPNARTSELVRAADGTWLANLRSAPVDGKANDELVALVAQQFKCRRASVSIKAGISGRTKLVKVKSA